MTNYQQINDNYKENNTKSRKYIMNIDVYIDVYKYISINIRYKHILMYIDLLNCIEAHNILFIVTFLWIIICLYT
jgi:hypothetical protein